MGAPQVAAHAALLSLVTFCFNSFPFAWAHAATIRVGNLLTEGRVQHARLAGLMCVCAGAFIQWCCAAVVGGTHGQVARIFTDDAEVLGYVRQAALYAMAAQFVDGAFGVAQGVLRGMGRQTECLIFNAIGFWGVGVAAAFVFAFQVGPHTPSLTWGMPGSDMGARAPIS